MSAALYLQILLSLVLSSSLLGRSKKQLLITQTYNSDVRREIHTEEKDTDVAKLAYIGKWTKLR